MEDLGFKLFKAVGDAMLSGKHSRGKVLEAMRLADNANPKAGWNIAAGKLKHRYEIRGMDINKKAGE